MILREFSKINRERSEHPNGYNHPLGMWSIAEWFMATMGELGEAANVAKKLLRIRDNIPGNNFSDPATASSTDVEAAKLRMQLADELADTAIYLDLTAQAAGIDLEAAIIRKFNRNTQKLEFPEDSKFYLKESQFLPPRPVLNTCVRCGGKGSIEGFVKGDGSTYAHGHFAQVTCPRCHGSKEEPK